MYESRRKSHVDFDIGVPINVIGPGGNGTGEVRLKISGMKAEGAVLAQLGRQLIDGIEDQNTLCSLAGQLFKSCDPGTLTAIRAALDSILQSKTRQELDGGVT